MLYKTILAITTKCSLYTTQIVCPYCATLQHIEHKNLNKFEATCSNFDCNRWFIVIPKL